MNRLEKTKAIKLIDEKISQFQSVLVSATYETRYDEKYNLAYYGTRTLLTELFSEEEAKNFKQNVTSHKFVIGGAPIDYDRELHDYKEHIRKCISQLMVYQERIKNFWDDDQNNDQTRKSIIPFISKSFDEVDDEINHYIIGILKALKIDFKTGESYSKDSIPQKVQSRIRNSDLFIIVFVQRDKIESGGYTTPSWLLKELGIAQGSNKEIIAWVEKGIKDIAGLNYEKEVIYFERENLKEMKKATIKFLEALSVHNCV